MMNRSTISSGAHTSGVEAVPIAAPPRRLVSLDAFRGIAIAGMLLVNNPGSWSHIYPPLRHAPWHGWTPTDLIFPFFLFIVGVAMAFSFGTQLERGATRGELLAKAAKRSLILVALGLVLHSFPWWSLDLTTLRLPGVLQRIGLVFLAASPIVLWLKMREQALVAAGLLLGYWALMSWVPVPGMGAGVWGPGQDLGAYLDRMVFGTDHLWAPAETWDPEGLLSTIPAIATTLLGTLTGHWIRSGRGAGRTTAGMLSAGVVGLGLGAVWGLVFPINKNLWTSSYTVFTAGMALLFLAACYWLVDVRGLRRWAHPFVLFGTNAIAAFFLSSLGARVLGMIRVAGPEGESIALKAYLFENAFASWLAPINASLAFAVVYVLFWLGVVAWMYQRRIFLRV